MTTEPDVTVILSQLNALGGEYGKLLRNNEVDEAEMNRKIDALRTEYGAKADPRVARAEQIKAELRTIIIEYRPRLFTGKSKTLVLRNITVSLRNADSIEVTDFDQAIRFLRAKRLIKRFVTRKVTLTINKKALGENHDLARTIPGIEIQLKERATFTLPKVASKPYVELNPQRIDLPDRS